jgi:hypothetical protein
MNKDEEKKIYAQTEKEVDLIAKKIMDIIREAYLDDTTISLLIALMRSHKSISWKSKKHDDDSWWSGYFIVGMDLPGGDITFHLPLSHWRSLSMIKTLDKAPKFDSHTTKDVIERLLKFLE